MTATPSRLLDAHSLVSVVVIFLNGEQFIGEAIDSVFAQTYKNWELLLVDDGSTDGSTAIAQRYAAAHPGQVRYLEHEGHRNHGMSATRNLGAREARGEFIALLDCDDVWLPEKLERQVAIMQRHPQAGMVFGASQYWHSWAENPESEDSTPDLGVEEDTLYEPPELLCSLYPLGQNTAPCPSDLLIRRSTFDRVGAFREEFRGMYSVYEDQAFLTKVYLHATVFVSGETWTRYRVHPESCMAATKRTGQNQLARSFFLKFLDRYLAENDIRDLRIRNLLRKAFWQLDHTTAIECSADMDIRELKWQLRVTTGNRARLGLPSDNPELVRIDIDKAGTRNPWDIQLNQPNLTVKSGCSYRIVFRARADKARQVGLGFSRADDPWDGLGYYGSLQLTTEWQDYNLEFVATADHANARIHFDAGGDDGSVDLASLVFQNLSDGRLIEPDFICWGHYPAERWTTVGGDGSQSKLPSSSKDAPPRFSVVIPTYQRKKLILQAVMALANQDFDGGFEVIIVIDGSRDGSAEALRALRPPFPFVVLEQTNQGAAAARNRGAEAACGEILLFIDDDMEAHPRLLSEHYLSHSAGADVVIGNMPIHPDSPPGFLAAGIRLWAEARGRDLAQPGVNLTFDDLLSGQISLKRDTFQKVRGFDTNFTKDGTYGHEDLELGYRLLCYGCKAVFNRYAISYQKYIITPRQHLRQARQTGCASVNFVRKHQDQISRIFGPHLSGRYFLPRMWRALAALRPLSSPVTALLRAICLFLVEHGIENQKVVRFFFEIFEMEFWRGVREAGGMPDLPEVRVLAYHAIRDLANAPVLEPYGIPAAQFRKQLKTLQRLGFRFITPDHFLRFLHGGHGVPRRSVLLTFDDCYDDLLHSALPVLKQLGIPAVAFAVSGRLGRTNTWDESIGAPTLRLLDQDGLQFLTQHEVEIGAHSRTHRALTSVPPEEITREVAGSIEELEGAGIKRPRLFAYPGGDWNFSVRQAARDAGLDGAFTVKVGCARQGQDPFLIPRIEIFREDTGWKFLRKVMCAV